MDNIIFTNNASGTLASSINSTQTALVIASGPEGKFPSPTSGKYAYLTLTDTAGNIEIVKLTARSGTSCTIVRAQQGTTARAWTSGASVSARLTAAALTAMVNAIIENAADITTLQTTVGTHTSQISSLQTGSSTSNSRISAVEAVQAAALDTGRFNNTVHGVRGGGTLHSVATTTAAGFMSATDKVKLDGVATGANASTQMSDADVTTGTATAAKLVSAAQLKLAVQTHETGSATPDTSYNAIGAYMLAKWKSGSLVNADENTTIVVEDIGGGNLAGTWKYRGYFYVNDNGSPTERFFVQRVA